MESQKTEAGARADEGGGEKGGARLGAPSGRGEGSSGWAAGGVWSGPVPTQEVRGPEPGLEGVPPRARGGQRVGQEAPEEPPGADAYPGRSGPTPPPPSPARWWPCRRRFLGSPGPRSAATGTR